MGWKLAAEVSDADVSPNLRAVLVILCDVCAMDDPDNSFASVSYVAYESGYSVRQARRILRTLELARYITCLTPGVGRGHTNRYRIHLERIPRRPKWRDMRARLIELGELDNEEAGIADVHAAVRHLKRKQAAEQAAWDTAQEQAGQERES